MNTKNNLTALMSSALENNCSAVNYVKHLVSLHRSRLGLSFAILALALTSGQSIDAQYLDFSDVQLHSMVGNCLDADTGAFGYPTYMRPCDDKSNLNLRWDMVRVPNGFQIRTRTTGFCLDANTGQFGAVTYMRPCDDGSNANLVWHFQYVGQGFQIRTRTTEFCLDADTGQFGAQTYMRPCDSGANMNLHWGMQH